MKRTVLKITLIIMAIFTISVAVSALVCRFSINISEYSLSIKGIQSDAKLVCISDLHSRQYGDNNEKLLGMIQAQKPDAIFVLGDMINSDADDAEIEKFLRLMEKLECIAQVYFSPGNHEMDYMFETSDDLMVRIAETGAIPLCDEYVETEIGGNAVRVGGSLGHYYQYDWTKEAVKNPPDYKMEKEIGSGDEPALVMLHMPESLVGDRAAEEWTGDLYLSGHTHGGVIRIPWVGGVFAPTQGLFPEYDCGQYTCYGKNIIITSGLSGYDWIPRIFNRPEICVITLSSP